MLARRVAILFAAILSIAGHAGLASAYETAKPSSGVCSTRGIHAKVNFPVSVGGAGGVQRIFFEVVLQNVKKQCVSDVRVVAVASDGQHLTLGPSKPQTFRKFSTKSLAVTSTSFFDSTSIPVQYPFLQKTCQPKMFEKFILIYTYGASAHAKKIEIAPMFGCSSYLN